MSQRFVLSSLLFAIAACGSGGNTTHPDGNAMDGANGPEDPALRWGAAGTGCPVRASSLSPVELIGASHGITWEADVSVRVAAGDGAARAYSASPIVLTNQDEIVTSASMTTVTEPIYLELSTSRHDVRFAGRAIEFSKSGPRRLCVDGVRGNVSASVALDAQQVVIYTDIYPGSSTSAYFPAEAWVFVKGSGQVALYARSRDADVELDPSLGFTGTCSGGVCDGTLGSSDDIGASMDIRANGAVHILRDRR
ncbi:MAG: hypothetical protein SFX73_32210 [Kofleriaceae bacterium]|nr:hypothetical protein [Kofleriaceae bacterium]